MEERGFDRILFTVVITVVAVLGFFVVNPGGASRELLEKTGLWETFYENYLPALPSESGIVMLRLPQEIPIQDRWDRLIAGLKTENEAFEKKIAQYEVSGSVQSGDARALERRISANEKKIEEYRALQLKDREVGPSR